MNGRVDIPAEDVWGYIMAESPDETDTLIIAENEDAGTCVTVEFDDGLPVLAAYVDDEEVERVPVAKDDCGDIAQMLYDTYISSRVFDQLGHDSDDPMDFDDPPDEEEYVDEPEDPIVEREYELDDAVYALLLTILGDELRDYNEDEIIRDTKEHLFSWLAEQYGASPYRPMMLVNDKGEEMLAEYPYDLIAS